MRSWLSILSFIFLCSFILPTNELSITGHLRSKSHKTPISNVYCFVKENSRIIGATRTDQKGNFLIEGLLGDYDTDPFFFYYVNQKNDTVLLKKTNQI